MVPAITPIAPAVSRAAAGRAVSPIVPAVTLPANSGARQPAAPAVVAPEALRRGGSAGGGGGGDSAVAPKQIVVTPRGGPTEHLFARAGAPGGRAVPPPRAAVVHTPLSDSTGTRGALHSQTAARSGPAGGAHTLNGMAFRVQGRTGVVSEQQVVRAVSPEAKVCVDVRMSGEMRQPRVADA